MKKIQKAAGFTLIELLVVITIIAILAGIALPVYTTIQEKGAQTKALQYAKQVGLALKLYAGDNDGLFPYYKDPNARSSETSPVTDANEAFRTLFPAYITSETIFAVKGSKYTLNNPDNRYDDPFPVGGNTVNTLQPGENHWAYVRGLRETSNSAWPLLADGFAGNSGAGASAGEYVADQNAFGGVWKGQKGIVVRVDTSAAILKTTGNNFYIPREDDRTQNMFRYQAGGSGTPAWLSNDVSFGVLNPAQRSGP